MIFTVSTNSTAILKIEKIVIFHGQITEIKVLAVDFLKLRSQISFNWPCGSLVASNQIFACFDQSESEWLCIFKSPQPKNIWMWKVLKPSQEYLFFDCGNLGASIWLWNWYELDFQYRNQSGIKTRKYLYIFMIQIILTVW